MSCIRRGTAFPPPPPPAAAGPFFTEFSFQAAAGWTNTGVTCWNTKKTLSMDSTSSINYTSLVHDRYIFVGLLRLLANNSSTKHSTHQPVHKKKLAKETNQSLNSNLNVLLLFVVFLLNGHEVSGDVCDNEEDECDYAEEQPHVDGL